jgi:hypothetical protein
MESNMQVTPSAGPASHAFDRRGAAERAQLKQECPGAPVKARHPGFIPENDDPKTPQLSPRDAAECPGAPLRKGHKGFLPEPDDGF